VKPSLLVWTGVRQLRRVSLRSSQDRSVAMSVQRGNAVAWLSGYSRALAVMARKRRAGGGQMEAEAWEVLLLSRC
jgi:hypothetical protein